MEKKEITVLACQSITMLFFCIMVSKMMPKKLLFFSQDPFQSLLPFMNLLVSLVKSLSMPSYLIEKPRSTHFLVLIGEN